MLYRRPLPWREGTLGAPWRRKNDREIKSKSKSCCDFFECVYPNGCKAWWQSPVAMPVKVCIFPKSPTRFFSSKWWFQQYHVRLDLRTVRYKDWLVQTLPLREYESYGRNKSRPFPAIPSLSRTSTRNFPCNFENSWQCVDGKRQMSYITGRQLRIASLAMDDVPQSV